MVSSTDVDAITSIAYSTKRDDATNIGKFGVGFKAVFAYTKTPEVESGEFHFRIHDMMVPDPDGLSGSRPEDNLTRFVLPFDNPKKPKDRARSEVELLLKTLDETTLLFLTHIRKIEYCLPDSSQGCIERFDRGRNGFEIQVQQPSRSTPSSTWFLKFDKEVQVEDDEAEEEEQIEKSCRIALAFALNPVEAKAEAKEKNGDDAIATPEWELVSMQRGSVCIYFPAGKETSNLRFHLHAPFASTVARDSIRDCADNIQLRDHLVDLLAESMPAIREQGLLTVRALALLPNDKDNLSEFYKPFMERLVEEFKNEDLVPMKRGGHAAANGIFRGKKALSDLIDDRNLARLLKRDAGSPLWAANPPQRNQREHNFLSMLEIEEWDTHTFVKILAEMEERALEDWLRSKKPGWHQRLYETLNNHLDQAPNCTSYIEPDKESLIELLSDIRFILCSDDHYRKAGECFFPTKEVEKDTRFPRVARAVFSSGENKTQQEKARSFLESIGVHYVDEKVRIEDILNSFYGEEATHPQLEDHCKHLAQFIHYLNRYPEDKDLFNDKELLMTHTAYRVKWAKASSVYLAVPFEDTSLRYYYDLPETKGERRLLAKSYREADVDLKGLVSFCKKCGAVDGMTLEKCKTDWGVPGECRRQTNTCIDEDYRLPEGLENRMQEGSEVSTDERMGLALLIWKTMTDAPEEQLWGKYRPNQQYDIERRPSRAISSLKEMAWVPQVNAGQMQFVLPRNAVAEQLPEGFSYETGSKWLSNICFGEGIEDRREGEGHEKVGKTDEEKEKILIDIGFESLEEAGNIAKLKRNDPDGFRRWVESRQGKPAFPEKPSADPKRREEKSKNKAKTAPPKRYDQQERRGRTSRTSGKDEVDEYLRDLYTNDDKQLICQICQDEMPFRKKNGKHYFEKVEAFEMNIEFKSNHLALCPVCAAKYDEFVFHGGDDSRRKLREAFTQMSDTLEPLELPVALGGESAKIRFVQNHVIDLQPGIRVDGNSIMKWVVENIVARSCRPGYPEKEVHTETVQATVEQWKSAGIASVLCLLDEEQLSYYNGIPGGLMSIYRTEGLVIGHVPVVDHKDPPLDETEIADALACFDTLPKPVLVHCSAGQDRTGQVVKSLLDRMK